MRISLSVIAACLLTSFAEQAGAADPYPSRPIRVVVPFVPGGVTDISLRNIMDHLTQRLGQSVVIDNRPGASGNIGAEQVAHSAPDGYTLLHALDGVMVINPHLYSNTGFDTLRDFVPVTKLGDAGLIIVANPSLPVKNLADLIALAKSRPGELAFGSSGVGGTAEATCRLLFMTAGVELTSVNYKGGGAAVNDVLGNHIPLVCTTISSVKELLKTGRLKGLGLSSAQRSPAAPDVPTFVESGFPGLVVNSWVGLFAPKGTPDAVVRRLQKEVHAVLQMPDVRERYAELGIDPVGNEPEAFDRQVRADLARWQEVVAKSGLRIQ
ncbi:tripartite tricarboxylate transporter substrate binding protein [Pigmentiphaga soli]|uniref:Tripartite tricarboxylate transporter substrate binding protein n=1 Tax=Pigmentiphaga soli TaxID=1007095 RepID=A0ABP8HIP2_9BURK